MNLPKIDLSEAVAALLARGEPLTAAQLAAATGKSVSSISLAVGKLGDRVHRIGAARSTRYALKKDILGLTSQHDLVWSGPESSHMHLDWGQITYLHGDWLHIHHPAQDWLVKAQLPWFLQPLRPQGFLGRALARSNPSFPGNPEQWTFAQILYLAIAQVRDPTGAFSFLHDMPGSWTIADPSQGIAAVYEALAQLVSTGLPAGSSAAGEQPKFLVRNTELGDCIVKFTQPRGTPFGERWHALLLLEKLALDTLRKFNIATADVSILQTPKRSYLQAVRFDRAPITRHIVAIQALHDEFVKDGQVHWVKTSQTLHAQKLISAQEVSQIASIHAFGHFIGNTDMHFGNLSFFVDDVITPKIRLAPVYDMLPMMWRPDPHYGLSDSPVRQQFMPAGFAQEQAQAREWAIEFWEQAALLDIGAELQAASLESARRLKTNFANV